MFSPWNFEILATWQLPWRFFGGFLEELHLWLEHNLFEFPTQTLYEPRSVTAETKTLRSDHIFCLFGISGDLHWRQYLG